MKKDSFLIICIILLGVAMYGLTLRGAAGNPTASEFKNNLDMPTKAFELSPERGRYIHVVSLAETGNFAVSQDWANVAYPDVGVSKDGRYYSFFAPGVSYIAAPFYLVGSRYGYGQVAAFSVDSLATIVTLVFIFIIGRRIFGLPRWAAFFAVLVFAFASTSWSYAITLYQNAFTTCLIVTAFYSAWRFKENTTRMSWLYAMYVWFAYGLAFTVDYPNAVLFLPIMFYLAYATFRIRETAKEYSISIRYASVIASVGFVIITGLHLWHNAHYYGKWSNMAGTLTDYELPSIPPQVTAATSTVASTTLIQTGALTSVVTTHEKSAVGFFHEKNLAHGFYILMFSDDRGLLLFSPIFIFAFAGILYLFRHTKKDISIYVVPFSLFAVNLFLYSSWGDPWGGWAFGPRYLIPSMPWLALFAAVAVSSGRASFQKRLIAFELFLFSSAVSLLGALTTNAIPDKVGGLLLPAKAYNFILNLKFLGEGRSGSFVYNTFLTGRLSLAAYFVCLYLFVVLIAAATLFIGRKERYE